MIRSPQLWKKQRNIMQTNKGFGLLESLFALFILSVGIMGTTAMVTNAFRSTDTAALQSQSVILAYDIADKIRANARASASYAIAIGAVVADPPDCDTGVCNTVQFATSDLALWKINIADNLPSGDGSAVIAANTITITIQWDNRGVAGSYTLVMGI